MFLFFKKPTPHSLDYMPAVPVAVLAVLPRNLLADRPGVRISASEIFTIVEMLVRAVVLPLRGGNVSNASRIIMKGCKGTAFFRATPEHLTWRG